MKNENKSNENVGIPPYLFVMNPYSGKHVNVLPMFEVLDDCWHANSGDLQNFIIALQEAQDFLALEVNLDDLSKLTMQSMGGANFTLITLRKMFEAMAKPV